MACTEARGDEQDDPKDPSTPSSGGTGTIPGPIDRLRSPAGGQPEGRRPRALRRESRPARRSRRTRACRVNDDQHTLQRRRARAVAARGLPLPREDHPLRPRADPGARRARARRGRPRLLPGLREPGALHAARFLQDPSRAHARLRALLDGRRLARLDRPGARRARLRREVLHGGRHLRPRREQHARLLHPGRDQVPGPGPRGEAGAAQRDAAGGVRARHVLGLHLADARVDAHDHVGDVGSRDPAQLPHDGGLRRPHLPPRQRRGRVALRQVPLEAAARRALGRLGRGAEDLRQGSRLPPPRPLGGDRAGQLPGVRARRADRRGGARARLRLRPARPDEAHPRGARPRAAHRPAVAQPQPGELLRGDGAGRVPSRATSCPASTSRTIRCCRAGSSPTPTRS